MRKIFVVIINNKEYDVYDIENKEHEGMNGEPKTWWLYHNTRLPDGTMPAIDSDSWAPYSRSIERHLWDIKFTQKTTTKEKYGDTQFRSHTHVEMHCNNKLIYSFGTTGGDRGLSFAMAKVQYMQTALGEHPYNFFDPEKERGRKIYWHGLPATVKPRKTDGWEIGIIPDYTCGLSKEAWWKELKNRESLFGKQKDEDDIDEEEEMSDYMREDYINWGDAFSDQHINWFRK